jgi:HK97 family phage prohead protease/HK97 family phage major capsid protein
MPMNPRKGEDQSSFMGRCVPEMISATKPKRPQDQAVAICLDIWRKKDDAGEDVVHKDVTATVDLATLDYVMSDGTVDRYGDIIDPNGWDLGEFRRNPVLLWGHQSKEPPIGRWDNIRVEGGKLKGKPIFAAKGTSPRIDEIRSLAEQGLLPAVSVGFRPVPGAIEARSDGKGLLYKQAKLLECSLVSIPANPNALAVARSLNVSPETVGVVFGKSAEENYVRRDGFSLGKMAASPSHFGKSPMNYSEQIEARQAELNAKRDHIASLAGQIAEGVDGSVEALERATAEADSLDRTLTVLRQSERHLAHAAAPAPAPHAPASTAVTKHVHIGEVLPPRRPFAVAAEKVAPADLILRGLVARIHSYDATKNGKPVTPEAALAMRYGEDGHVSEQQRVLFDVVCRASTAPATTTTSGWASQLVNTAFAGFQELLMPASVYPGLASRGLRLNFGRNGVISVPTRSSTPTVAGSFVAEGSPIPVRQAAFSAQTFVPKKLAVISTFTREISEYSNPSIEALLRQSIQEDTSVATDTVLMDATAASSVRPAGLRNGVSGATATTGGGFAALVGDLKTLMGTLVAGSNGNLRQPRLDHEPSQALSISVTQNAGGDFPFQQEINNNRFMGYPVILSSTVTAATVFLLDADDFVSVEGDVPVFSVSDQASLHLDDTTPLAIGTAGSPNSVAAPVRSLFQTDSIGLRMTMLCNWGLRRTGTVAYVTSVTW